MERFRPSFFTRILPHASVPASRLCGKRREYAAAAVQEHWVIDRFRREMTVFRGLRDEVVVAEGEVYQTPLLPGFELPLADLLAKADKYHSDRD